MTDFGAAMRRAANLTRSYNLLEATRVIQDALAGRRPATPEHESDKPLLLASPERADDPAQAHHDDAPHTGGNDRIRLAHPTATAPLARARKPLGEVVRILREGRRLTSPRLFDRREQRPHIDVPEGARYVTRAFSSADGSRSYMLYSPARDRKRLRGLVVMLHGCTQDPDDFAIGTAMNELAEIHGLLIAYPHQTRAHNPSACWNWFRPGDQLRGQGEPAIVAGLARELASEFGLGREQTFVAGLSAGGAMAMVLAETYPDVFAAVGVHSGLDYRSAIDVASAFTAMRGAAAPRVVGSRPAESTVRTIVFHGASDPTVHPSNADRIAARLHATDAQSDMSTQRGAGYTRVTLGPEHAPTFEKWSVDGLAHAWSGGNPAGSFTDARGPSASAEMVRFFLG